MGLFLNSPFAVPKPSFPQPVVPPQVEPTAAPTATIKVSCEWLPFIRGALQQLTLQATWLGTLDEINLAQNRANALIELFLGIIPCDCTTPCPEPNNGICCDGDADMGCCSLRVNNGVLQCLCGGVWQDVPGQISGFNPFGQPGVGSPQPAPGGGQVCYQLGLQANGQVLIPTLFNTGDQVVVQSSTGAGQDNAAFWWTPDGQQFVLGEEFDNQHTDPADPFPAINHGTLLLVIAGQAFPCYAGQSITIPGGIVNQPAVLRPNLAIAGGNGGSYDVSLCAINNQAAPWSHTFDFTLSPQGWSAGYGVIAGGASVYHAGGGWGSVPNSPAPGNTQDDIFIALPARTITGMEVFFTTDTARGVGGARNVDMTVPGVITYLPLDTGAGTFHDVSGAVQANCTMISVDVDSDNTASANYRITKVIVRGLGTDPF